MCCTSSVVFILSLVSMQDVQSKFYAQVEAIKNIPMRIVSNWPAFFSFGFVDFAINSLINMVPMVDGGAGTVLTYTLRGMRDTTKQVTWEAIRNSNVAM